MLEDYIYWSGNIDDLMELASDLSNEYEIDRLEDTYSVRLVRDYIQRGLLGNIERSGKELRFEYEQLLRFIVVRVLLADGWMLNKIQEQLSLSSIEEIEGFLPSLSKQAFELVNRLRDAAAKKTEERNVDHEHIQYALRPDFDHSDKSSSSKFGFASRMKQKIQRSSNIQREMKEALRRFNLPDDGPETEDLKLIAIAPFCQVLITEERFQRLSVQEARELGDALTASLTAKILNKGAKR